MSTNKNAFIRYRILDECFRNPGKRYGINDLIAECEKVLLEKYPNSNGISRRQIYEDIAFLESSEGPGVELEKIRDGRNVYYHYSDPHYSIFNIPISKMEMDQLVSAMSVIGQFEGLPQFEWVKSILSKLSPEDFSRMNQMNIISFDINIFLKGLEHMGALFNAIRYHSVLKIKYQPYSTDIATDIILHPYFLKQYNNRWFLFGYNPQTGKSDWNLALDRIQAIKDIPEEYKLNDTINWNEYFDDIIGVTKPDNSQVENIKLHFHGITGKYVESKPIHGSQHSKWLMPDLLEVNLQLIINSEFERLILSYCDTVSILEPKSFRKKIIKSITNSLKQLGKAANS